MRVCVGTRTLVAKTCTACGVLKTAEEFGWVLVGGINYRNSSCKRCNQTASLAISTIANNESRKRAVNLKQPWTSEDIRMLDWMTEQGYSVALIARKLGRTNKSVYTMRNRLKGEPR